MFAIIWSAKAAREYLATLEFWMQHNKSATYSTKLMNAVDKTVVRLSKNPKIGSPTIFEGIFKIQVLRNFSLIYPSQQSVLKGTLRNIKRRVGKPDAANKTQTARAAKNYAGCLGFYLGLLLGFC